MDNRIIKLETKIKDITNELTELKAELEKEQKCGRWKPELNNTYWFIEDECYSCESEWGFNCLMDKDRYAIGNCFATEEEADFEIERLKVIAEMREFEESPDREWDCINSHYYIFYDARTNEIEIDRGCGCKSNNIYFETEEKARECVLKVGADRIKRFYLRIKDD